MRLLPGELQPWAGHAGGWKWAGPWGTGRRSAEMVAEKQYVWLHKAFACFVLFYFYFIVVSSTFSSATKIYVSVVKKKRRAWYKQLPFLGHNEHWSWKKTQKPQADSAHLSPRGSGGTRCVLYIAVLLFHWQLRHLENKNKDKIFLGVTLMFTGHIHFTLFRISSLF